MTDPSSNWGVFRQDFTGNEFLVQRNLSKQEADDLVVEFESHKHHQHYWASEIPDTDLDYAELLTQSLRSGSSLDSSLTVLRNQNASAIDCIKAVKKVKSVGLGEAKMLVVNSRAFADGLASHKKLIRNIEEALNSEQE